MEKQDLIVIGGGPGGYVAAIQAAKLGLKTAVVEEDQFGGVCVNWGCIPTKALLRNAEIYQLILRGKEWGFRIPECDVDWPAVIKRSRRIARRMATGVEFLLKQNNVSMIQGRGRLAGTREIEVTKPDGSTESIAADGIILATGAHARKLPGVDFDGERIITSKEALALEEVPKRLLIVGAGAIGVEFAQIYGDFGSEITIVEMLPELLPVEDEEISLELRRLFKKRGWKIHTGTQVTSLVRREDEVVYRMEKEGVAGEFTADMALVAIGVEGNVKDLGLEAVGIHTAKGFIKTGSFMETGVPGIYAIGDVAGPPWLAHVASHEGITAVLHFAGKDPEPADSKFVPACTYCHPPVASVGLTERQAAEQGIKTRIGRFPFRANGRSIAQGESEGFIKLIFSEADEKLIGAHILGPEAPELLAELGLAATAGTTRHELLGTIHAHPTLSEVIHEAAGEAFGEAIHI
ncbi:MAG: dihydrolipoyl dehydrogenase [Candidatus Eisenbacteria bacterium]|nr:dihydrolipoyl dehydrogenase [Candidatus Eisenbacteria bacterium]MBU1950209.1 dihydrolipoyl dehydrogenase [Candidatus Eisenbacteria bacterium]